MSEIQNKMFLEIRDKNIFNQAQEFSLEYLENVFDRNVYPTEEAVKSLSIFDEELPTDSTNAKSVIEQLTKSIVPPTRPFKNSHSFLRPTLFFFPTNTTLDSSRLFILAELKRNR